MNTMHFCEVESVPFLVQWTPGGWGDVSFYTSLCSSVHAELYGFVNPEGTGQVLTETLFSLKALKVEGESLNRHAPKLT